MTSSLGIDNTINQGGLATGFISGVTSFDDYLAGNPLHSMFAGNKEWLSEAFMETAQVDYDLGSIMKIDRLALWNEDSSGIGSFDLLVSSDGTSYLEILTNMSPADNPVNQDYLAEVFSFDAIDARYVRLAIADCPQGEGGFMACGIGEVAFSAPDFTPVPVPPAALMFGSALALLGWQRTRRPGSAP
ncbi:MAG: discoidin domain-containing protein [Gammaproteobacteria bacterium]